ncbi:MAG: hypothetical protein K0S51_2241 [Bacillales bacterium]|jgi:hypothetical protein|nr:hypothetical protein [Bacillales bacterium]
MTSTEEVFLLIVIAIIIFTQGTLLFIDARKRTKYYWFWGLWGLIQFPLPSLFYWFFILRKNKKRRD